MLANSLLELLIATLLIGFARCEKNIWVKCATSDCSGKSGCVTIYQHRYYGGWFQCLTFEHNECMNLNEWWRDRYSGRVSSVDPHGTCVRLYQGPDCEGESIEVKPGSPSPDNLNQLSFEDIASSASACSVVPAKVSGDEYKECTRGDCSGKTACATIYESRRYWGWYQCLSFTGSECITLNYWWRGSDIRYFMPSLVSSVKSHDTCVRLYDDLGCKGLYIEVTRDQDDLRTVNFFQRAKSVSPCGRATVPVKRCIVTTLFTEFVKSEEVSSASNKIMDGLNVFASRVISLVSNSVPGLTSIFEGLKLLNRLFDSSQTTDALIDAKIEEAFARNSASQISAKMHVVNNRLESILSPATTPADKRIDLGLALHTCEEVKKLFEDKNYSFSQNKLVSSPYLVAFSAIYWSVAKLAHEIRSDLRESVGKDMLELETLLGSFMEEAITQRKGKLSHSWGKNGYTGGHYQINDSLCKKCDAGYRLSKEENARDQCLVYMKTNVDAQIRAFFKPVMEKLKGFPNQESSA